MNTDIQVAEYLTSIKVEVSPSYIGERLHQEWKCDLWLVRIGATYHTEYKTGLGHRVESTNFSGVLSGTEKNKIKTNKACYPDSTKVLHKVQTIVSKSREVIAQYAVTPTQASILYCLLLDAQAADESFNSWCDNFGYSSDSIEAFNMHQQCCETGKQLNKVFTRKQIEHLQTLLEDY